MKKFTIIVEKTSTGYSAYVENLDGAITVGDTLDDIKSNINEVLELYFEEMEEKTDYKLEFKLSIETFFNLFESINITKYSSRMLMSSAIRPGWCSVSSPAPSATPAKARARSSCHIC